MVEELEEVVGRPGLGVGLAAFVDRLAVASDLGFAATADSGNPKGTVFADAVFPALERQGAVPTQISVAEAAHVNGLLECMEVAVTVHDYFPTPGCTLFHRPAVQHA